MVAFVEGEEAVVEEAGTAQGLVDAVDVDQQLEQAVAEPVRARSKAGVGGLADIEAGRGETGGGEAGRGCHAASLRLGATRLGAPNGPPGMRGSTKSHG